MICVDCYGDAESVDGTSLYRCGDCGTEFDEDELAEDGSSQDDAS